MEPVLNWEMTILVHSPNGGGGMMLVLEFGSEPIEDATSTPKVGWQKMAGVLSPWFAIFPPIVRWRIFEYSFVLS